MGCAILVRILWGEHDLLNRTPHFLRCMKSLRLANWSGLVEAPWNLSEPLNVGFVVGAHLNEGPIGWVSKNTDNSSRVSSPRSDG
jgi:hypothetical protein